jgi:putative salt-induced outer membrane protein
MVLGMPFLLAAALATSLLGGGINLAPAGLATFANDSLVSNPGEKPKALGFGGTFNFGYLSTHSSTTTSSLNAELKLGYNTTLWQHRLDLQAVTAATDDKTTAEQYFGAFQSNRLLSTHTYAFGYLGYLHDRFSGYRYQASELAGYGVRVVDTKTQTLAFEAGVGLTQARQIGGPSDHSPAVRGSELYDWKFSSHGAISQSLMAERSNFNLYSQFKTQLAVQLVGNLALTLGYTIQHNSNVAENAPQTTSMTSISVQYAFGQGLFGK